MMGGLMRHQLATPNSELLGPDFYNQLFTMHGTTMMFLFAVPVMQGFARLHRSADGRNAKHRVPADDGLRLLALPDRRAHAVRRLRLNTGADAGWFAYVPLAGPEYGIGKRADFWNMLVNFTEAMG